jgi:hypothetical protein
MGVELSLGLKVGGLNIKAPKKDIGKDAGEDCQDMTANKDCSDRAARTGPLQRNC